MKGQRGLSVIEIMVSLVLLATGVMITMGAISFGTKATFSSSQSTEASAYARRLLEIVLAGGPVRGPLVPGTSGDVLNPLYDDTFRQLYGDAIMPPFERTDFIRSADPQDLKRFASAAHNYEARVSLARFDNVSDVDDFRFGLVNVTVELRWHDRTGPRSMKTEGIFKKG